VGWGAGPWRTAAETPGAAPTGAPRGDRLVVCLIVAVTLLSPFLYDLGSG
jgi:hypothetical protein